MKLYKDNSELSKIIINQESVSTIYQILVSCGILGLLLYYAFWILLLVLGISTLIKTRHYLSNQDNSEYFLFFKSTLIGCLGIILYFICVGLLRWNFFEGEVSYNIVFWSALSVYSSFVLRKEVSQK